MVGWHHCLNGHEFEQTLGTLKYREAWRAAVHGVPKIRHDLVTEQQQLFPLTMAHVHGKEMTQYLGTVCLMLLLLSHFSPVLLCATP